ncbi:WbqC family protein [Dyella mobilis]|nr:WbqC family protein [Dyella mobilis]
MLTEEDIVSTLSPLNGVYFHIDDLQAYAHKLLINGKSVCTWSDGILISYVLFYDNGPEVFISMVWTNPKFQNKGHATLLLEGLIRARTKPISLEVDADNPARLLYRKLGFRSTSTNISRERMTVDRRIAIMQPYVYPYIGYFQLINATDFFVFYDDVNYIKRGFINKNNILLNGEKFSFTIPIANASQNRLIKDTHLLADDRWKDTLIKQLIHAYKKAPYFNEVMASIIEVIEQPHASIADMAITSIASACNYLDLQFTHAKSSDFSPETQGMEKSERLVAIAKKAGGERYVNSIGGMELYSKDAFTEKGMNLSFLESGNIEYRQFDDAFLPRLSIIDVMMFNHAEACKDFCSRYSIV